MDDIERTTVIQNPVPPTASQQPQQQGWQQAPQAPQQTPYQQAPQGSFGMDDIERTTVIQNPVPPTASQQPQQQGWQQAPQAPQQTPYQQAPQQTVGQANSMAAPQQSVSNGMPAYPQGGNSQTPHAAAGGSTGSVPPIPPKKSKAGLIIGIIAGVLVFLGLIVGVLIFVFSSFVKKVEEQVSSEISEIEATSEDDTTEVTTEETTTEEVTTEAETTEEVTTEEETTEEETTEEETTEPTIASNDGDYEVDYPGKYSYALSTGRHGNETLGYIDVPSSWGNFYEQGGDWSTVLDHQQYSYANQDIITHYTIDKDGSDADIKTLAEKMKYDESVGTVKTARFGSFTGYYLEEKFSDGIILRRFFFNDGKQHVQVLAVEGYPDDEYSDVWRLVFQNYSFEE